MTEQDQSGKNLPTVRQGLDIDRYSQGLVPKSPSAHLVEYGFTPRLPVLLAELNSALSDLSSGPSSVRMVLSPNLETPEIAWQLASFPPPQVELDFPLGNKKSPGEFSIGKPILDVRSFYRSAGDKRYDDYDLKYDPRLVIDRRNTRVGFHERADSAVAVDLKTLKEFVRRAFPNQGALLVSDFEQNSTDEQLKRLSSVAHVHTYSGQLRSVLENLYTMDNKTLQGLPEVGYSVIIVPRDFIRQLEESKGKSKNSTRRYAYMDDVPDQDLRAWYDYHFRYIKRIPQDVHPETFLYVTVEEPDGDVSEKYFKIRRLEYTGIARSIERVMGLTTELFAKDPTGHSQFKVDVIRKRYQQ